METYTGWYLMRCRGSRSLGTVARELKYADWRVSRGTIHHYEKGKQLPEEKNLLLLAYAYQADLGILEKFFEINRRSLLLKKEEK